MPTDEAEAQMLGSADLDDMKSEWTLKRPPPTLGGGVGLVFCTVPQWQRELNLTKLFQSCFPVSPTSAL